MAEVYGQSLKDVKPDMNAFTTRPRRGWEVKITRRRERDVEEGEVGGGRGEGGRVLVMESFERNIYMRGRERGGVRSELENI